MGRPNFKKGLTMIINACTLYYEDAKWHRYDGNLYVPDGLSILIVHRKIFYFDAEPIDKMDKRLSYWHDKYPEYFI